MLAVVGITSAHTRDVKVYRKHLEHKLDKLNRIIKEKYPADIDPLDPGT